MQRLLIERIASCDLKVCLGNYVDRMRIEHFYCKCELVKNFIFERVLIEMKVLMFNCLPLIWMACLNVIYYNKSAYFLVAMYQLTVHRQQRIS